MVYMMTNTTADEILARAEHVAFEAGHYAEARMVASARYFIAETEQLK